MTPEAGLVSWKICFELVSVKVTIAPVMGTFAESTILRSTVKARSTPPVPFPAVGVSKFNAVVSKVELIKVVVAL